MAAPRPKPLPAPVMSTVLGMLSLPRCDEYVGSGSKVAHQGTEHKPKGLHVGNPLKSGAPGRISTHDPLVRSQVLVGPFRLSAPRVTPVRASHFERGSLDVSA